MYMYMYMYEVYMYTRTVLLLIIFFYYSFNRCIKCKKMFLTFTVTFWVRVFAEADHVNSHCVVARIHSRERTCRRGGQATATVGGVFSCKHELIISRRSSCSIYQLIFVYLGRSPLLFVYESAVAS